MYDEELEKIMLYYLIFEEEQFVLDEDDFVSEANKKIIKAINELKAEKKEISMIAVKSKIKADSTKVLKYLSELSTYTIGTNAESVYNKIIALSKQRKIFDLLRKNVEDVKDVEDINTFAEKLIKDINKIQEVNEKEKTFVEQVADTVQEIEQKVLNETDYSLYTGMLDLDKIICGLHNEELTIIGARPRYRKNNICIANSRKYCFKRSSGRNN